MNKSKPTFIILFSILIFSGCTTNENIVDEIKKICNIHYYEKGEFEVYFNQKENILHFSAVQIPLEKTKFSYKLDSENKFPGYEHLVLVEATGFGSGIESGRSPVTTISM
jgi:hypothetical protein